VIMELGPCVVLDQWLCGNGSRLCMVLEQGQFVNEMRSVRTLSVAVR
jgi:hypothetical protein